MVPALPREEPVAEPQELSKRRSRARTPDASLKALAADAGIDVVVASRTVADMHSRGLVDKRRSPGNKRLVCLRLTDDGVQIHGKAKLMAAAYNR